MGELCGEGGGGGRMVTNKMRVCLVLFGPVLFPYTRYGVVIIRNLKANSCPFCFSFPV